MKQVSPPGMKVEFFLLRVPCSLFPTFKSEGKKAFIISFLTFFNWIVISATLH
jgi:hypothetical protein